MSTDPTTCTCEGDVIWNEGIPHWTGLTDPDRIRTALNGDHR